MQAAALGDLPQQGGVRAVRVAAGIPVRAQVDDRPEPEVTQAAQRPHRGLDLRVTERRAAVARPLPEQARSEQARPGQQG